MKKTIKIFSLILGVALLTFVLWVVSKNKVVTETRLAMDTVVTIKAWGPDAKLAIKSAFEIIDTLERQVSFHKEGSELSRLNKEKSITTYKHNFEELLSLAMDAYKKTDGYFDPTFASLNRLYGFYNEPGDVLEAPPEDSLLAQTLAQKTGLLRLLSKKNNKLELDSEAEIDLGGIAGGYAMGIAVQVMASCDCETFMIDNGGDIVVKGAKPDGSPWVMGVFNPVTKKNCARVRLGSGLALATSGSYERFVSIAGKQYGHIMNPHSGRPAEEFVSVTVIAGTPVEADVWSTALFAMPRDKALSRADELKLPALFITAEGELLFSKAGKEHFELIS